MFSLFLFLFGLAYAQPPAPGGAGQILDGQTLLDHDTGFTLTIPSTEWRLAPEQDARALLADAIAGAMAKNGHFGVIVVEDMAGDLAGMNDLLLSSLSTVITEKISQENVTFQGQPAIRSLLELNVEGVRLRQQRVVFEWDHHLFQLVCNGPLPPANNRCGEFMEGFKLNGTAFRTRERPPTPDVQTRRWRVKDGQFESAVSAFTLRPPPGWRLMVGGELERANASAEVGMTRDRPEAYAIIIPERAGAGALEALLAQYRSNLEADLQGTPGAEVAARVGDKQVGLLEIAGSAAVPIHYWHGAFGEDTRYWQLLLWSPGNNAAAIRPEVEGLFSSFTVMDEPRRAALERELSTIAVPVDVGAGWSVREQVYTNYDKQLSWPAPPGLWEVSSGAAAEAMWTGSLAVLQQPASGAYAVLVPLADLGSLAKSHDDFVDRIGMRVGKTINTRVAGAKALTTELETDTESLKAHWRVSSFKAPNGEPMAIVAYALTSAWEGARADVVAATDSLASAKGVVARRADKRRFESHRLGVGMALDGKLPCTDPVPDTVKSQADGISCLQGGRGILLMAVRDGTTGVGGEEAMLAMVHAMLGNALGDLSGLDQVQSRGSLDGVETLRLSFGPHGDKIEVDVFTKDKVVVIFMAIGMLEAERQGWRSGVYLLDSAAE